MSIKMVARITSYEEGQLRGELDSIYFKEPHKFADVHGMIEIMETAFDALGFPDKALLPRTFGKAKERMRRQEMDLEKMLQERKNSISSADTDKGSGEPSATLGEPSASQSEPSVSRSEPSVSQSEPLRIFEIFVNFRLNAEWQGRMKRADGGEAEPRDFRSIVELVRLIDEEM